MKKILFFLFSILAFSIAEGQTHLTAPLVRNNPADNTYGTHIDSLGYGGLMALYDTIGRNNIPIAQRKKGMIVVTNDSLAWQLQGGVSNANWIQLNFSGIPNDTIYVQPPLYVYYDSLGRRVIAIQQPDGLISGGIVTWTGTGLYYIVSPATYIKNGKFYSSSQETVTLSASDPTFSTQYVFVVDTTGHAGFIRGTPAALPLAPQLDESQLALTSGITILAGATTPDMYIINIFDENLGTPTEWAATTTGTITKDFNNTDNPYHLTKADFTSVYANNAKTIFTSASVDTVLNGEVLSLWIYLNIPLGTNRLIFQFFNGATSSSALLSINNTFGLDPNLTGQYQHISIPLNAFTWTSTLFTNLKITNQGNDLSGAGGYYIDWVQLQTGINNLPPPTDYSNKQDSNHVSNDSLFWCVKGICHFIKVLGTGGGNDTAIVTHTLAPDSSYSVDVHANRSIHLSSDTLRVFGGGGGSPVGNYGNLQINRNSVFATPATDSLSFNSGVLTNKGSSVIAGTQTIITTATGTAGTDSILVQNNGLVKKISPTYYGTGGSQTLQQVFNTETGGSLLTKSDTINVQTNNFLIKNSGINGTFFVNIDSSAVSGKSTSLLVSKSLAYFQSQNLISSSIFTTLGADATLNKGYINTTGGVTSMEVGVFKDSIKITSTAAGDIFKILNSGATTISTTTASLTPLTVTSTSGTGVNITATTGSALILNNAFAGSTTLKVNSTAGGTATFNTNPSSTNTVVNNILFQRNTSATAADGIGQSLAFQSETDAGGNAQATNTIVSKWTTAANATRTSELSFTGINSTAAITLLTLSGKGNALFGGTVQLMNYTVSTLPTGVRGMTAYVTDALTPTFGTTLVGGGAVVAKAFFDGTNWINE